MIDFFTKNGRGWLGGLLIAGLLAGTAAAQDIFQSEPGVYSTTDLRLSKPMAERQKVLIRATSNLLGQLTFTTADQPTISMVYVKVAKTGSRTRAFDYIDLMSVSLDLFPDYVRLDLRAPNPAPWQADRESGSIDAEITVPEGCAIEIEALYFDVVAEGPFQSLTSSASLGRYDVSDVRETLKISTANRRVKVERISGDISVTTSNAELDAIDIQCPAQAARFRNDGGDIRIAGLEGQLNVKNSFGRIDVIGFRASGEGNFIRSSSGPIEIELDALTDGQLVVNNRYEDIEMLMPSTISAFFSLAVDDDGVIDASNITFTPTLVKPNRLAFSSGGGDVDISASIRGKGNILITGIDLDQ